MRLTASEVAASVGGRVLSGGGVLFTGAAIDSRSVAAGDLFVALKGPNHDAHDYLGQALAKAPGALVSRVPEPRGWPEERALIQVPDTLLALQELGRAVRERLALTVVGITGTVGKTTTKEMTAKVLASRYRVARSEGNLNNAIGLPLTVARMPEGTEVGVLEMGMSSFGEIRRLSELFRPRVATVTAVTPVHMMSFSSLDDVMEAKGEILAGVDADGVFAANADDARCLTIATRHRGRVVTYGQAGPGRDLDATLSGAVFESDRSRFTLHLGGSAAPVELPLPGRHNVSNFLAASAMALALGLTAADVAAAAESLAPVRHRGEVKVLADGVLLYDDTYNSSPAALRAAFAAFEEGAGSRRRIAVVGEMRELGEASASFHEQAGRDLAGRCAVLVAVQGDAAALAEAARGYGSDVRFCASTEDALALVRELLRPGDALFVKGSRGVGLDRLVDALAAPSGERA